MRRQRGQVLRPDLDEKIPEAGPVSKQFLGDWAEQVADIGRRRPGRLQAGAGDEPAWLLASYARDGLSRLEAAGNAASLGALRSALEGTLGIRFEGERGERFFRSMLIQTLIYGIFSAWVLW